MWGVHSVYNGLQFILGKTFIIHGIITILFRHLYPLQYLSIIFEQTVSDNVLKTVGMANSVDLDQTAV